MSDPGEVRCLGCGGFVPDTAGPVHAYMRASPGCWQIYAGLLAGVLEPGLHHVDAYAAQHPDGADRDPRQRRSVAVHLTALCLGIELGIDRLDPLRARLSATVLPRLGLSEWPLLRPPRSRGAMTAADLAALEPPELPAMVTRWREEVWSAWSEHHETVRGWARAAI